MDNRQIDIIHQEVARMARYMADAKQEIFAIKADGKSENAITDASQHLDAVIKDTEEATHTIMDAADHIQAAAAGVGGPKEKEIVDSTNRIYDACNFQDITGQRIRKVIRLLENIEGRVTRLNSLFGAADAPAVKPPSADDEQSLLNGPQLRGQGVSQADVDAMFKSSGGKK